LERFRLGELAKERRKGGEKLVEAVTFRRHSRKKGRKAAERPASAKSGEMDGEEFQRCEERICRLKGEKEGKDG